MRLLACTLSIACAVASFGSAQAPAPGWNMSVLRHVGYVPCTTADVWAMGDFALVARRHLGFAVIDLRDPDRPRERTFQPAGFPVAPPSPGVNDVTADARYYYISSEISPGGVYIYDARKDPMNPQLVTYLTDFRLITGVHNLWIDGDTLYCAANATRFVEVYDVSDRANPVWLSSLGADIQSAWAHDVTVIDDRAYCSFVLSGIGIYDVSNPRLPVLLAQKTYPGAFTHNLWPSKDGRYLYSTDEAPYMGSGGHVRIWDISELPAVTQVGAYKAGPKSTIVHNVVVHEDMLFVAYYREGVRVLDIQDPTRPVEIAYYDTFPPEGPGCWAAGPAYAGAWGVYPFNQTRVLVTDLDTGAYVLSLDAVPHTVTLPPSEARTLGFELEYRNNTPAPLVGFGLATLVGINGAPLALPLLVDAQRLQPGETRVQRFAYRIPPVVMARLDFSVMAQSGTISPVIATQPTTVTITVE